MSPASNLNATAVACLEAARLINQHGSPALQQAMRVVLFIVGQELARQAQQSAHSGTPFAHVIKSRQS